MPKRPTNQLLAAAILSVSSGLPAAIGAPSVLHLGIPLNTYLGLSLSRDGSTFVGYVNFIHIHTPEGGLPDTTELFTWNTTAGFRTRWSWGTTEIVQPSANGEVVVGGYWFGSPPRAFRWNTQSGVLTQPPGARYDSRALAVTPDGGTMIYSAYGLNIWDGTTDRVLSSNTEYHSGCVSDDAKIVVASDSYGSAIHRWNGTGGRTVLAFPSGVSAAIYQIAMSSDGHKLYAFGSRNGESVLVRWKFDESDNATSEVVCALPQGDQTQIAGTTSDGSTVAFSVSGESYFWIESIGLVGLEDHLRSKGVQLPPAEGRQIGGISGDGSAFVGSEFLRGGTFVWYVNLDPTARQYCPADFNFDAVVDDTDFAYFAGIYDVSYCRWDALVLPRTCPDLNHDSLVDDADFTLFAAAYDTFLCP